MLLRLPVVVEIYTPDTDLVTSGVPNTRAGTADGLIIAPRLPLPTLERACSHDSTPAGEWAHQLNRYRLPGSTDTRNTDTVIQQVLSVGTRLVSRRANPHPSLREGRGGRAYPSATHCQLRRQWHTEPPVVPQAIPHPSLREEWGTPRPTFSSISPPRPDQFDFAIPHPSLREEWGTPGSTLSSISPPSRCTSGRGTQNYNAGCVAAGVGCSRTSSTKRRMTDSGGASAAALSRCSRPKSRRPL